MFIELRDFYLLTDILFSVSKITLVNIVKASTTVWINLVVMKGGVRTQMMDVSVWLVINRDRHDG